MKTWRIVLLTLFLSAWTSALAYVSDVSIRSLAQLGFGFGPSIEALIQSGRFGMPSPHGWTYAHRMPFIILLLYGLHGAFRLLWPIYLAKGLLCSCAVIYVLVKARLPLLISLAFLLFVYAVPYNASVLSRLDSEEAYLFFLLTAALWIVLDRGRKTLDYLWLGLLLAAIYLTKSSTGLLCFALGGIVLWQSRPQSEACTRMRRRWLAALPLALTLVAALGWGAYIYARTGVFAVGTAASSWNGWNFHKGNNPYAIGLYPSTNLDVLDQTSALTPPGDALCRDEWCSSNLQLQGGKQFFLSHPREVFRMDLKKFGVVFWRLAEAPAEHQTPRVRDALSLLVDHCVLLAALLLCFSGRARGYVSPFALSMGCYILPFFSSFLYHRHMLPAYGMSAVFLLFCASQRWREARGSFEAQGKNQPADAAIALGV